jgi:YHS domain-containing protein
MRVGEWTATIFKEYQGQRYAFCSQRCLERFKEDPQSYVNRKRGVMPCDFIRENEQRLWS